MSIDNPMRLLLIEDDVAECLKFKDCSNRRADITFVGMTDSCEEGIKLVKSLLPEAVILDLQLVKGLGSGLKFLELINEEELTFQPIITVTTSNQSKLVCRRVEELGIDWFFCKTQKDYNEDFVIETLLSLRSALHVKQRCSFSGDRQTIESPEERNARIYKRIDAELDLIGVRPRLTGREYLREAIFLQITSAKEAGSVIEQVALKHRHAYGTISKVMQTAINNAWDNAAPGELQEHYTAHVSVKTGVPSASDFVHYYADKIRRSI